MAKQFGLDGIGEHVEFGKDGNKLDMSNGHGSITNHNGVLIELRGKDATHANAFATKGQLDCGNRKRLWNRVDYIHNRANG